MDFWHFEYFRIVSVKELSLSLGTSLWEDVVLRAAVTESCILHAVLALGALCRDTLPSCVSRRPTLSPGFPIVYALRKYNLAIEELNRRLAALPSSWELAVLGSMIFTVIETLQGNHEAARVHLRGAKSILRSHEVSGRSNSQLKADLTHLLDSFSCLDHRSLGLTRYYILTPLQFPTLPTAFTTISDARDTLNSITGAMNALFWRQTRDSETRVQLPLSPDLLQGLSKLSRILEAWQALFAKFVSEHVMDTKTMTCIRTLDIVHRVAHISVSAFPHASQTAYDAHISDFLYIIELATQILEAEHIRYTVPAGSYLNRAFDIAIVQPLFFVACKCRNRVLRQKAIEAMGNIKGETFCDSQLMTRIAKCVVTMEEAARLTAEVPRDVIKEEDRLQDVELDFASTSGTCRITAWKRLADGEWRRVDAQLPNS